MNYKSTLIYLIISTLYLLTLKLVWIILSVLQGLELTNITLETNLILGLSLSLLSILFGNKINLLIKNLGLSLIFTYIFYVINNVAPLWFYFGIFLIYFLFLNNIRNYDLKYLNQPHVIEKVTFKYITLFGIVFFNHQIGSFLGAYLGGYFYDKFGSFDYAWYLAIVLSFIATAIHLPIDEKPISKKLETAQ